MKFKIDDQPFAGISEPPIVRKFRTLVQSLPDGELISVEQVCARARLNLGTVNSKVARYISPELKTRLGNKLIYGNKKTITAWRSAHELQD